MIANASRVHAVAAASRRAALGAVRLAPGRAPTRALATSRSSSSASSATASGAKSRRPQVPPALARAGRSVYNFFRTGGQVGVVLFGVSVGGLILYALGDDLFSSKSPNNVYTTTVERLRNVTAVTSLLGTEFKGLMDVDGERHRRARHVPHTITETAPGHFAMKMRFYIKAADRGIGKVDAKLARVDGGDWEYQKMTVEVHLLDGTVRKLRVV
ncbi:Mitochondrial import inner membrane translocase subunit Tim21 [Blastocladiella emersonii ATCC 22665]|nr:Mitochondrial import inner membrane translocase subunit Tim21 [Blastocladiella emersonii ATCC 22665]